MKDIVNKTCRDCEAILADMKRVQGEYGERAAAMAFASGKTGLYRQFKWLCRAINKYNRVIGIIEYHLNRLGASQEDIDAVMTILNKYNKKSI
jgi:adenine-specific DNA methylase